MLKGKIVAQKNLSFVRLLLVGTIIVWISLTETNKNYGMSK